MKNIDQAFLKTALTYEPSTGHFTWASKSPHAHRIQVGDLAGRTIQNGYIQIGIKGTYFLAHRLAFLYMTGALPDLLVDHINGNPQDNRWNNLRLVTPSQNSQNAALSRRNISGVTGVSWNSGVGKWVASIHANGKFIHLGCFDQLSDAQAARKNSEIAHKFHPNHGKSK